MTAVRVIVEAGGGARGNVGPAGWGAVIRDPLTGSPLARRSASTPAATSNVAEYRGLIAGLSAATELGAREVLVRMDSKLVVAQMTGRWKIKHPVLRALAAQAASLLRGFQRADFEWVPRASNVDAGALAGAAMDLAARAGAEADRVAAREAAARGTAPGASATSWEPRTAPPTRMLLVRHGQTAHTADRRYSGRGDVPLSETGIEQAKAAARRIAGMDVTVATVVTSPLSRCAATAAEIGAALRARRPAAAVPVVVEPDLIECDFGEWEGKTFAEVRARSSDQLNRWLASTRVSPPGGESFEQVATRVRRAMAGLREAYQGQVLIVVSHVGPIKLALRDALAAGDEFLHRMHLDPAGISTVDSWADGGVSVRHINDIAHLV